MRRRVTKMIADNNQVELSIEQIHKVTLDIVKRMSDICEKIGGMTILMSLCYGMIMRNFVTIVYTTKMK